MKRHLIVIAILLSICTIGKAQNYQWADILPELSGSAQIQQVKYDNAGNIITFGKYFNQVQLGQGASSTLLTNLSGDSYFLAKYSASTGDLIWALDIPVEIAISENNQAGLAIDDGNNVYITANYQGDITIGGSTFNDVGSHFFMAKYDVDGNFQFANRYTASGLVESRDIALDINGGIYITGHFSSDITFGLLPQLISNGDRDIFILQLDPSGNPIDQLQVGGANREEAAGIEVEGTNEIYLAGMFRSSLSFIIGGTPVTINPTGDGFSDVFLTRFFGLATPDAVTSSIGSNNDEIFDIELDPSANNIYVTGSFESDLTFTGGTTINSSGFQDVFTSSLTVDFTENWITSGGGTRSDYGYGINVTSTSAFITGYHTGIATFSSQTVTANSFENNFFIAEYSVTDGSIFGLTGADTDNDFSRNYSIDGDEANGNLVTGGLYSGLISFNGSFYNASTNDLSLIQTDIGNLSNTTLLTGSSYYSLRTMASSSDATGNLYITGMILGSFNQSGIGSYIGRGRDDAFLAKFDTNGNLLWLTGAGGPQNDEPTGIAIDPSTSDVVITGTFSNSFSSSSGTVTGQTFDDIFMAKFQPDGTNTWAVNAASSADQLFVNGVAIDGNSNIFITGNKGTTDDTNFNGPIETASGDEYYLAKYGPTGAGLAVDIQPAFEGSAITVDNGNNVIVGGSFSDFTPSIDFGGNTLSSAGSFDVFTAKYDNNLNLSWVRQAGGTQFDQIQDIDTDSNGDIAITGYFRNSATFGTETVTGTDYDMYVAKYLANGDLSWIRTGGGSDRDEGEDIIIDASDNILVSGWFGGSAFFDCFPISAASAEDRDIFITRYSPLGDIDFAANLGHPILSCSECTVSEEPFGLSLDATGSFYLTGNITGTTDFGGITVPAPDDEHSFFLTKFTLSAMSCPPPPVLNTLYWTDTSLPTIFSAETDGSNQFGFGGGSLSQPAAFVIDDNRGIIFYSDTDLAQIIRLDFSGGTIQNQQTIVDLSSSGTVPGDLEFDNVNKKLYWSVDNGNIQRSDPDGSNIETVITGQEAAGIAINPSESKIYWTTNVNLPSTPLPEVRRADYSGGDLETIYSTTSTVMGEIEVNATNGRVYWAEIDNNLIGSSTLEGGDQSTVVSGVGVTFGLALAPADGLIYFHDAITGFNSVNLDGTNVSPLPISENNPFFLTLSQDIDIASTAFAAFSFTGTPCVGNSLVFSDESDPDSQTILNYQWNFGDGSTATTANPSHTYSSAGTYEVSLTITLDDATVLSATQEITVFAFPQIDLGGDITICETQGTIALNATISSATSPVYTWSTSGSGTFSSTAIEDPVYTVDAADLAAGSVDLTLTVDDTDTPCGNVSSTLTVSIVEQPTANAGGDQDICSDEVVNISGSVGGDATTGSWTTSGDGTFADDQNLSTTYTPGTNDIANGSVALTLTAPSQSGVCSSASDQLTVNISESLTVGAGADASVCAIDNLSLSGSVTGDLATVTWSTSGDGTFADANALNTTYTPGAGDANDVFVTLTLTATSSGTCASVTDETEIEVLGPPAAVNYSLDAEIGQPLTINLQADNQTNESGELTFEIIEMPTKGVIDFDGSAAVYTANSGTIGSENITYEVTGLCGSDQGTIDINILNDPPAINPPSGNIPQGEPVTISLEDAFSDLNGNLDLSTLEIISEPISGAPARLEGFSLIVDYTGISFQGTDEVVIRICDDQGACAEATILIEVVPQQIVVYNAVSPNGDGSNDYWRIDNLFAPNEIKLYNRWGDEVKKLVDYSGEVPNNQLNDLPPGTYFYEIKSTSDNARGYLVIKK